MSGPFAPGEVVVCVDASRETLPHVAERGRSLRIGSYYRVVWCAPSNAGHGIYKVRLVGDPEPAYAGWRHTRFRKFDAADEQFSQQIRACRPHVRTREKVQA